jgi:hypothetical protein
MMLADLTISAERISGRVLDVRIRGFFNRTGNFSRHN